MRIDELPRRLGILGGGYVGCELAHVFAAFGTEVVQIEAEDSLLGNQDDDVGRVFTAEARKRWDVRLGTKLESVSRVRRRRRAAPRQRRRGHRRRRAGGHRTPSEQRPARPRRHRHRGRRPRPDRGRRAPARHRRGRVGARRRLEPRAAQARGQPGRPGGAAQPAAPRRPHGLRPPPRALRRVQLARRSPRSGSPSATPARRASTSPSPPPTTRTPPGAGRSTTTTPATSARCWPTGPPACSSAPTSSARRRPRWCSRSSRRWPSTARSRGLARHQYWIHPAPTEVVENALLALEKDLEPPE